MVGKTISYSLKKGEFVMPEIKKIELEKVNAALKRLRALPVKDNRKSLTEALVMLSGDIQAAIAKGYSRRAIRNILAEGGVIISTTSLNNFLSGEQKKIKEASSQQKSKNMEASMKQVVNNKNSRRKTATNCSTGRNRKK
jgi:hypothetical protein